MIDLHSHILYDIDDGSKSFDMSIEMLRMAAACGTTDIIATPHVNRRGVVPEWSVIVEKATVLQEDAKKAGIPITIHTGAEVEINFEALNFLKEDARDYCIAGSRYILCELTNQSEPKQTENLLFELMVRGYRPILAHPERYDRIMEKPRYIWKWLEKGVLTQCNGGSFIGYFGEEVQRRVEMLARKDMICFLGSDAHRTTVRNPDLAPVEVAIKKLTNGAALWQRCEDNGRKLLNKKAIYPSIEGEWREEKPKKKGFFAKLFG
ncbi:tyrosine-protein phosphatase [Veillonella magna]|uniref:tyrosine-protein phosphatase n=1 Tax=Veillonella magna TaxID=464322 RepID=UPI0023F4592D|nr:CpsB/CapC family capsule biosynthesis tyrosine phosphatase [Veillonella magna]MBD8976838.1 protein tyrosine phosphatase [Veillonella magna]